MLRMLHTADWHLGHMLNDHDRTFEHQAFLTWLVETIVDREVDVLLIAGDVFDTANPPIDAMRLWYHFLAEANRRRPHLQTVVVAGNHDSPGRLTASSPLMAAFGVTVVGSLPRKDGVIDGAAVLVPLQNREGDVAAWVAAVPFLRYADVPLRRDHGPPADQLIAGVQEVYDTCYRAAREQCGAEQALIMTGHCYMVGGAISELSERRILAGHEHALPASTFPEDVAYVALGHLHKPQLVGRETIRYSGAPLPLSGPERGYAHSVTIVEFEGARVTSMEPVPTPRPVAFLRVPERGTLEPEAAIEALENLDCPREARREQWPFLEVHLQLEGPRAGLQEEVRQALEGKGVRLLRIAVEYARKDQDREPEHAGATLAHLTPGEVFERHYQRKYGGAPPEELQGAFERLLLETEEGKD